MRVAIVGDMNSNGYALLRYLRESGVDAHLLQFSNNGVGGNSHFSPEAVSNDSAIWAPYIHRLRVPDYFISAIPTWVGAVLFCGLKLGSWLKLNAPPQRPVSRRVLIQDLGGFDRYIGQGVTPALFARLGWTLDIFLPYSTGVEYVRGVPLLGVKGRGWIRALGSVLFLLSRRKQIEGIKATRATVVFGDRPAQLVLQSLGVEPLVTPVPNTYLVRTTGLAGMSETPSLPSVLGGCDGEVTFFSPVRQYWDLKRNFIFLRGYAQAVQANPSSCTKLILMEYGEDVGRARDLIDELGMKRYVVWFPRLPRKDIQNLMQSSSVVVGQFDKGPIVWGNVGWEAIAQGRPLLQGFYWSRGEFEATLRVPEPPIIKVRSIDDVAFEVSKILEHPSDLQSRGTSCRAWFDAYHGSTAARRLMTLLDLRPND